jgi:hypothetical protein
VDFSDLSPGDWLMIAGGAVMLIFGLALDWASLGPITENNAFDYFLTGGIAWLLVVAAGIVAFLAAAVFRRAGGRLPVILLIATGIAAALMLLRLILGAGEEAGFELDRSSGMYIAFLAAAVSFAGALSNFRAERDHVHDDVDQSSMP